MTVHAISLDQRPLHRSFRLSRSGEGVAVQSQVRPALVLTEREARALLAAAAAQDVSVGGCCSAGPAGVQVWSGPWTGPGGSHGDSVHLGSVDWSYDTPSRHYITVYRVMVTTAGVTAGSSTASLLERVLALAGLSSDGERAALPAAPSHDPFRARSRRARG